MVEWCRDRQNPVFSTTLGCSLQGLSELVLSESVAAGISGEVDLIFTSPPFPLVREKSYGNKRGSEYIRWLASFAQIFKTVLKETGSLVLEIGNAWEERQPTMSTVPMEALLAFKEEGGFHLCQELIWHNTAKVPGPAQWVTVERVRLKDSFSRIWWLSRTPNPKADNKRVLVPYSAAMKRLLEKQTYNAGKRPSQHKVGAKGFLRNNGGAISPSVLSHAEKHEPESVIHAANTSYARDYTAYCARHGLKTHPARMPEALVRFFVSFLTDSSDVVLDPFAGTNTTGAVCEELGRQWISIEADPSYALSGIGRFGKRLPTRAI